MSDRPSRLLRLAHRASMLAVIIVLSLAATARASADLEPLRAAIDKWSDERDAWAFTLRVREVDDRGRNRERVERYDPSRGDADRWTLVSIDDRTPTEKEIAAFHRRKGAKRQRPAKSPSEYVAFDRVAVLAEDTESIQYAVPLREDISRLIPLEQLIVIITVDRAHCNIRHLAVGLDDPMRIALGLLRVTDLNFDLRFEPGEGEAGDDSANPPPVGVAEAAVSKFGKRAEFSWSDFTRVKPPEAPAPVVATSPPERRSGTSKP